MTTVYCIRQVTPVSIVQTYERLICPTLRPLRPLRSLRPLRLHCNEISLIPADHILGDIPSAPRLVSNFPKRKADFQNMMLFCTRNPPEIML